MEKWVKRLHKNEHFLHFEIGNSDAETFEYFIPNDDAQHVFTWMEPIDDVNVSLAEYNIFELANKVGSTPGSQCQVLCWANSEYSDRNSFESEPVEIFDIKEITARRLVGSEKLKKPTKTILYARNRPLDNSGVQQISLDIMNKLNGVFLQMEVNYQFEAKVRFAIATNNLESMTQAINEVYLKRKMEHEERAVSLYFAWLAFEYTSGMKTEGALYETR